LEGANSVTSSASALEDGQGAVIDAENIELRFLTYVLSDDGSNLCGDPHEAPSELYPDIIDTDPERDVAAGTAQPIWMSVDVPAAAEPGVYSGQVTVTAQDHSPLTLTISLEVLSRTLPPPQDWAFHLELWQTPEEVAEYHEVEPWSQAHIDRLTPLLALLADAGQKVCTTSISSSPHGAQSVIGDSMVRWIKQADGSWAFDFTHFDEYVDLCQSVGITGQISSFTLVGWYDDYLYFDEASGTDKTLTAPPGTAAYNKLWTAFLRAFQSHLSGKGWLDSTYIALDEVDSVDVQNAIALINAEAPGLKVALASNAFYAESDADIFNWSPWVGAVDGARSEIAARTERGQATTHYSMCWEEQEHDTPNHLVSSDPAEQLWSGWFAQAAGLDGFLRWAAFSWPEQVLTDARHSAFQGGDWFLVYPGPRSSIRFESLRDGIEDFEKIVLLRDELSSEDLQALSETLNTVTYPQSDSTQVLREARATLQGLSRSLP